MLQLDYLFFFNDTATTEIYTLSLHDALPIYEVRRKTCSMRVGRSCYVYPFIVPRSSFHPYSLDSVVSGVEDVNRALADRKSTRLNSSHANISYAVFCLNKNQPNQATYQKRQK